MYIKSLELDGFKTYGRKVIITDFDKSFNAITGCNGTGKSNILDGICFVLGLTSLQHMRVSSLSQLIYKYGQAGVVRARASIVFDNTDPIYCPRGYENIPEITVIRQVTHKGKSKYSINGGAATVKRVHDLFRSIQLNVNNPHFLIMQGKITKVLNMKPKELLSMLEETVGTGMYEAKKTVVLKLIDSRRRMFLQVTQILNNKIIPMIESLKKEKEDYILYEQAVDEYKHLSKLIVAWEFNKTLTDEKKATDTQLCAQKEVFIIENKINEQTISIEAAQERILEFENKKTDLYDKLQILEEILKDNEKHKSLHGSRLEKKKDQVKEDNLKMDILNEKMNEEKEVIIKKESDLKKACEISKKFKEFYEQHKQTKDVAIEKLQNANVGLFAVSAEGKSETFATEMIAIQQELASAQNAEIMAKKKMTFLMSCKKEKEVECEENFEDYEKLKNECFKEEKKLHSLKNKMKSLNFKADTVKELSAQKSKLEEESYNLQNEIDIIYAKIPRLMFKYTDPVKRFDHRKVHGLVCNLFKVKDEKFATAIEMAAGSRLFNVIVDDAETGKLLISNGNLKYRYTVIPLNKVIGHSIPLEVLHKAEALVGPSNIHTALSLIDYEQCNSKAMQFVFGNIFICTDVKSASTVSSCKSIHQKCVTLDGDIFDPDGLVSGGSLQGKQFHLPEVKKKDIIEAALQEKQKECLDISIELEKAEAQELEYTNLSNETGFKVSRVSCIKTQLENSNYVCLKKELNNINCTIDETNNAISEHIEIIKVKEKEFADLQVKMKNVEKHHEQMVQDLTTSVEEAQSLASSSENKYFESKQECEKLSMEIDELKESCADYSKQLNDLAAEMEKHQNEVIIETKKYQVEKSALMQSLEEVKSQKLKIKNSAEYIEQMKNEKSSLQSGRNDLIMEKSNLEYQIKTSKDDAGKAKNKISELKSAHRWIISQKQFFGVHGSAFDFSGFEPDQASERCSILSDVVANLENDVNSNAKNTLKEVEATYALIIKKKNEVLEDELCLNGFLHLLDFQKKECLQNAYNKVNNDLNSIFSTLMPGSKVELVLHEDNDVMTGVSFKIGFGDAWKESLDELSGGQRSLVALSWILALLSFKPAPIYILDEIDAALDLHHTQNIGKLINSHFHQSQFIIVSLKEGMFKNANVIFKTMWEDGASSVIRTTQEEERRSAEYSLRMNIEHLLSMETGTSGVQGMLGNVGSSALVVPNQAVSSSEAQPVSDNEEKVDSK